MRNNSSAVRAQAPANAADESFTALSPMPSGQLQLNACQDVGCELQRRLVNVQCSLQKGCAGDFYFFCCRLFNLSKRFKEHLMNGAACAFSATMSQNDKFQALQAAAAAKC